MHDVLVVAKEGGVKTRLMYAANLSYSVFLKYLKRAEVRGFIEEVEVPASHRRNKSRMGWKTTEKGLRLAGTVYANYLAFEVVEE